MMENDEVTEKLWKEAAGNLKHKKDYLPWSVGLNKLEKYLINHEAEQNTIKAWILSLIDPYFSSDHVQNYQAMSTHEILLM